jgi:diguanylate cyclase (GGDEF)-like protein
LDHFKHINDTHGHQAGDAVLCETAHRMRGALRQCDWVGRYGGEEFLVVLPGCTYPEGMRSAERVRAALADEPFAVPGGAVAVTISLGMTTTDGIARISPNKLLDCADHALYDAKNRGRNRVEFRGIVRQPEVLSEALW